MVGALDVAKYFACQGDEEAGDAITNLKLQKLLYYAQGVHLALKGKPLFPERIEAWQHGPVVPDVYHACKAFGSQRIVFDEPLDFETLDEETKEILDEVYVTYGQFSAWRLRQMTHDESPWASTPTGLAISHNKLCEYFNTVVIRDDEAQ